MDWSLILPPLITLLWADPGLPPLSDRDRFPPREICRQAMQFNRAYKAHLTAHMAWYCGDSDRSQWFIDALAETDQFFYVWDWCHAAQGGEARDETYWREALQRVRDSIGHGAYGAGQMPPPVPVWRFELVKPP
jgi:hypothetical protein